MLHKISKQLTAGMLAVVLAATTLTATTTAASANGHRNDNGAGAAAVLGGLLLLYGIANANNGHGNVTIGRNFGGHGHGNGHGFGGHGHNYGHNFRVAPAHCFVQGHNFRGYIRRCMQRNVAAPHLLPQHCLRQIYSDHGPRQIYGSRCLHNNGWTHG